MGASLPPVTPMAVTFVGGRLPSPPGYDRPGLIWSAVTSARSGGQPVTAGAGPWTWRRRAATCAASAKEAAQAAAPSNSVASPPVSVTADPIACLLPIGDRRGPLSIRRAGLSGPARGRRALEACVEICHRSRDPESVLRRVMRDTRPPPDVRQSNAWSAADEHTKMCASSGTAAVPLSPAASRSALPGARQTVGDARFLPSP